MQSSGIASRTGASGRGLAHVVEGTLFDALFPNATTIHRLAVSAVFVALIIVCAKARFYLPDNPVNPTPITLQTFAVLLTGNVMGWRWGMGAVVGYIALGALGAPVFATSDGLEFRTPVEAWNSTLTGVVGGYIIGFVVAAGVAGLLSQMGFTHSRSLWANTLGGLLLYVPALIWLSVFDFGWPAEGELFTKGMYIYMPGDLTKILGASLVTAGLWNYGDRIIDWGWRVLNRIVDMVRRVLRGRGS